MAITHIESDGSITALKVAQRKRLIFGGGEDKIYCCKVGDARFEHTLLKVPTPSFVRSIQFNNNESVLLFTSEHHKQMNRLKYVDIATMQDVYEPEVDEVRHFVVMKNNITFAVSKKGLFTSDPRTPQPINFNKFENTEIECVGLASLKDDVTLWIAFSDNLVCTYDIRNPLIKKGNTFQAKISSILSSRDDSIAIGFENGDIELSTDRVSFTTHAAPPRANSKSVSALAPFKNHEAIVATYNSGLVLAYKLPDMSQINIERPQGCVQPDGVHCCDTFGDDFLVYGYGQGAVVARANIN